MTLPYTVANGDDADADPVQGNFEDLDTRVTTALTGSVSASRLTFPAGYVFPAANLPSVGGGGGGGNGGGGLSGANSDSVMVQALRTNFTRRSLSGFSFVGTETANPGRLSPTAGGAIVAVQSGDFVAECLRSSTGSPDDLMATGISHTCTAGDGPSSVVAGKQLGYVICQTTRVLKSFTLGTADTCATVLSLGADFPASSTFGKMIIDRSGRYLYFPYLKGGVDSCRRRIARVDLLSSPVSVSHIVLDIADDAAGNDAVDLMITYTGGASNDATGTVVIIQQDSAANGGIVLTHPESDTGLLGGAWTGTPTARTTYAGTEEAYAVANWRGRPAVITYDATDLKLYIYGFDRTALTSNTWLELFVTTAAASDDPLQACAATDGVGGIYCILDSGRCAVFDPPKASGFTLFTPTSCASVGSGNYEQPSGICWNGSQFIGILNRAGSNTSVPFIF